VGNDPVSGPDHLPGHLGVSQITVILETSSPEVQKKDEAGDKDEPTEHPFFFSLPFLHAFFLSSFSLL
jgi:hypothetical protein